MASPEPAFQSVQDLFEHFQQYIAGIQDSVHQLNGGQSLTAAISDFVRAIDWSERWIQAILAAHVLLLSACLIWRRSVAVQLGTFAACCAVVFCAEPLNRVGAEYWEEFARQPYFDKRGAFFSGLVSLPLVLIMTVIVLNVVVTTLQDAARLQRRKAAAQARAGARHKHD